MRYTLLSFFLIFSCGLFAQTIPGRVINQNTQEPLAYAEIKSGNGYQILTNIDGSFELKLDKEIDSVQISYVGFQTRKIQISSATEFLQIGLTPIYEELETVMISNERDPAVLLIEKAIEARDGNDPEQVLEGFKYTSYSKFIIDNEFGNIEMTADSTSTAMKTIINEGRAFLSEKVSNHFFTSAKGNKEEVIGLETAGFEKPVYNVLAMKLNPLSLYKRNYEIYKTEYAGPLANDALRNYNFKILDTTDSERPAYMVYFEPKREKVVAGLEGILYLDTVSLAIQKAKAQLLGAIKLEVDHNYKYYPEKDLWFPSEQTTKIRPGAGGKERS